MKRPTPLLIVAILLIFSACIPNQTGESDMQDPEEGNNQNAPAYTPFATGIQTFLPGWLSYYQERVPNFDLNRYQRVGNVPLDTTVVSNLNLSSRFMDYYGNYLIASPNEEKILDLYSYKILLEKNLRGEMVAMMDVDSEAAVLYPEENRRERILFVGPSYSFDDGYWIDNDRLVILGKANHGTEVGVQPLIFEVDLLAKRLITYEYQDTLPAEGLNYLEEVKFADVGF